MADLNEVDNMSSELESRLDDLFDENDIRLPDTPEQESKAHYPLAELKNLILSIDWEITDDAMKRLADQVVGLKKDIKMTKFSLYFSSFWAQLESISG